MHLWSLLAVNHSRLVNYSSSWLLPHGQTLQVVRSSNTFRLVNFFLIFAARIIITHFLSCPLTACCQVGGRTACQLVLVADNHNHILSQVLGSLGLQEDLIHVVLLDG